MKRWIVGTERHSNLKIAIDWDYVIFFKENFGEKGTYLEYQVNEKIYPINIAESFDEVLETARLIK